MKYEVNKSEKKKLKSVELEADEVDISVPEAITALGSTVFKYCEQIETIRFHKNLKSLFHTSLPLSHNFKEIIVDNENPYYTSLDGVLYNKDMTELIRCPSGKKECHIPSSVTSFSDYAFPHNSALENITVDEENSMYASVNGMLCTKDMRKILICPDAKNECHISDSITSFSEGFHSNLESIIVSEDNPMYASYDGIMYTKNMKELLICPQEKNETEYIIPDGTEVIADKAFCGCAKIKKIIIPGSIKKIGCHAFERCSTLSEIIISDGVTEIGAYAFAYTPIKKIIFPDSVTKIPIRVCDSCESLESVVLGENTKYIDSYAFACCSELKDIYIPKSIEYIANYTIPKNLIPEKFWLVQNNDGDYVLPNMLKKKKTAKNKTLPKFEIKDEELIRYNAPDSSKLDDKCGGIPFEEYLQDCEKAPSWSVITVPKGVKEIGDCCFEGCMSIKSVKIPEGVEKINDYAFSGCYNLTKLNIAESVNCVGNGVIWDIPNLLEINFVKNGKKFKLHFSKLGIKNISLYNNNEKEAKNLTNKIMQFIASKEKTECAEIISSITNEQLKNELQKIFDKAFIQ